MPIQCYIFHFDVYFSLIHTFWGVFNHLLNFTAFAHSRQIKSFITSLSYFFCTFFLQFEKLNILADKELKWGIMLLQEDGAHFSIRFFWVKMMQAFRRSLGYGILHMINSIAVHYLNIEPIITWYYVQFQWNILWFTTMYDLHTVDLTVVVRSQFIRLCCQRSLCVILYWF